MKCDMTTTIIAYMNHNDISVKFEDDTIVEHIHKDRFTNGTIKNPNMPTEKSISSTQNHGMMPCIRCSRIAKLKDYYTAR